MARWREIKVGARFGRLTVIGHPQGQTAWGGVTRYWYPCRCDCGQETLVYKAHLVSGNTKSCGCMFRELMKERYGDYGKPTRLIRIWHNMVGRCHEPRSVSYPNYGGCGIKVCDEWRQDYRAFKKWALDHGYGAGLQIDRIQMDGDYQPDNCRWVTPKENSRNRRGLHLVTAFGETKCMAAWLDDPRCEVKSRGALGERLKRGWPAETAISSPPVRGRPGHRGQLRRESGQFVAVEVIDTT